MHRHRRADKTRLRLRMAEMRQLRGFRRAAMRRKGLAVVRSPFAAANAARYPGILDDVVRLTRARIQRTRARKAAETQRFRAIPRS